MVNIKLKIKPFSVPSYVSVDTGIVSLKQDGIQPLPSYELKDLDEDTLSDLCYEFRAHVFLKAGKQDPMVR